MAAKISPPLLTLALLLSACGVTARSAELPEGHPARVDAAEAPLRERVLLLGGDEAVEPAPTRDTEGSAHRHHGGHHGH